MDLSDIDLPSVDHVLTTTRAVRQRLDLTRPVAREVIERCIDIAVQAPTAFHGETWQFVRAPAREHTHWNRWGVRE